MGYMCLFQFWFPQGICLGVGLLGHMVVLFLVFKGISILSCIVAVSIYIPTNSTRVFPFSTPSSAFIFCRLFDDGHSNWCEVISHCGFDLHFSNTDVEHLFMCLLAIHLYVFLGEMFLWVFCPFLFDWIVYLFIYFDIELHKVFVNFGD